jgi:hypothetical protein
LGGSHTLTEYLGYFRWIVNFLFVGMPWFGISIAMVIINFIFNIWLNQWWADGNAFLVLNSVYLVIQTVLSWPLVFELPFYLADFRFFRAASVLSAWVYFLVYVIVTADWIYQLYMEPATEYQAYDFISVMGNMFLAYNVVFNIPILPVSVMIMLKEFTLELFPPLLDQDEDEQLDLEDAEDAVSPISWWDWLFMGQKIDNRTKTHGQEYRRSN